MLVELERELKRKEQEVLRLEAKRSEQAERSKAIEADAEGQRDKLKKVARLVEAERD